MRNSGSYGSNLVEYIIPLALIAVVVGYGIYKVSSEGNLLSFFTNSSHMKVNSSAHKIVLDSQSGTNDILVSNLPEKNSDTVVQKDDLDSDEASSLAKECIEGLCIIDLGSYKLKGIPENFNKYVETAGASGATEKMVDLINQIAFQLEAEGKIRESNEIKKLASLGHNIGVLEKSFEDFAKGCNYEKACMNQNLEYYNNEVGTVTDNQLEMPEGFDETYFDYPVDMSYKDALYSVALGYPLVDTDDPNDNLVSAAYQDQLRSILANDSISSEIKSVIKELSWDIGVIGEDFQNNLSFLLETNTEQGFIDPLTGEGVAEYPSNDVTDNFKNYNASKITHFDSALICASGNNKDTGEMCH